MKGRLCLICETPFTIMDGVYICEEGHMGDFALEDEDVLNTGYKGARLQIERISEEKKHEIYQIQRIIISKIYFEVKKHFNFTSDNVFKIYLMYFNSNALDKHMITISVLRAIFYLSLRNHRESNGSILLVNEFTQILERIPLKKIIWDITKEYHDDPNFTQISSCLLYGVFNGVKKLDIILKKLVYLEYNGESTYDEIVNSDTNRAAKHREMMRSVVKRDINTLKMYLNAVADEFCAKKTEKFYENFEKFISCFDLKNMLIVPEDYIVIFIYAYFRCFPKEIDLEKAAKKICLKENMFKKLRRFILMWNNKPSDVCLDDEQLFGKDKTYILRNNFLQNLRNICCIYLDTTKISFLNSADAIMRFVNAYGEKLKMEALRMQFVINESHFHETYRELRVLKTNESTNKRKFGTKKNNEYRKLISKKVKSKAKKNKGLN
ncbi:hypothetical protein EDEG_00430 [Edhazardia aedis USNM 41457]|uniref:Uncharacterized protein n=1 Tax=Edhazardia aedis (strain USNM 41457) TaxID=1003232 RepID=J9D0X5_EDHAE|nr:hypothetical protein EDEG_00430 [Edhazardia aedis USNM 41457]|eukprot:EJW01516.1 hypothetical protein EDEG_00430 [Edhazardia aedis USNM 41457]